MITKREFTERVERFLEEVDEMLDNSTVTHLNYCDGGIRRKKDGTLVVFCINTYSPFGEGDVDIEEGVIVCQDGQIPYEFAHFANNLDCLNICSFVYELREQGLIDLQ